MRTPPHSRFTGERKLSASPLLHSPTSAASRSESELSSSLGNVQPLQLQLFEDDPLNISLSPLVKVVLASPNNQDNNSSNNDNNDNNDNNNSRSSSHNHNHNHSIADDQDDHL
jgi:hypothetical protein